MGLGASLWRFKTGLRGGVQRVVRRPSIPPRGGAAAPPQQYTHKAFLGGCRPSRLPHGKLGWQAPPKSPTGKKRDGGWPGTAVGPSDGHPTTISRPSNDRPTIRFRWSTSVQNHYFHLCCLIALPLLLLLSIKDLSLRRLLMGASTLVNFSQLLIKTLVNFYQLFSQL